MKDLDTEVVTGDVEPAVDDGEVTDLLPESSRDASPVLPRLGAVGWARFAWRQLTSMRTALLLLLLLAVAAVPGSVLPQNRVDPARVQQYLSDHPGAGPLLQRIGMFDVYASPWFAAVYLLLFVSLVGCLLPRTRQHWKALRAKPPQTPRRMSRMPVHVVRTVEADPDEALAAARTVLSRRHYRTAYYPAPARSGQGASVAGERGYLAETGNLLFHFALLALLVAVALGSMFAYSGEAIVVEGQQFADTLPSYDSFSSGTRVNTGDLPPFSFSLDAMDVRFDDTSSGDQFGAPRAFAARLTVKDTPSSPARTVSVQVNHPLDIRATRVFLSGNGYAPIITVRDGRGQVVSSGPVVFLPRDGNYTSLGVVKVPDAQPRQIALRGFFLPTAVFDPALGPVSVFPDARDPRLVLTAYVSAPGQDGLQADTGVPQSVYVLDPSKLIQLKGSKGDPLTMLLAPGQSATLPGGAGSVTFDGYRRYAAFDIRYDPSKMWALVAAIAALGGVTISLFVRRRRVWVSARRGPDGLTVVEVAGLARGEDAGLATEALALLDRIGPEQPIPERNDAQRPDAQRPDAERADPERADPERADAERADAEPAGAGPTRVPDSKE